jgi:hypothetical protein
MLLPRIFFRRYYSIQLKKTKAKRGREKNILIKIENLYRNACVKKGKIVK